MVAIFHIIVKGALEIIIKLSTEDREWKEFDALRNEYYDPRKEGKLTSDKDWELTEGILSFKDYLAEMVSDEIVTRLINNDNNPSIEINTNFDLDWGNLVRADDMYVDELAEFEYC